MSFSLTTKSITLHKRKMLHAVLIVAGDGSEYDSELNLDTYIGNVDGEFSVTGYGFSKTATDVWLEGSILHAQLQKINGEIKHSMLNLDFVVANEGKLVYHAPKESAAHSCGCFSLVDGVILRALCLGSDGKLHASEINLNEHLGNKNGQFVVGMRDYGSTGSGFYLDGLVLRGRLGDYNHQQVEAFYDLALSLKNDNGKLQFKHDGVLDRDGLGTGLLQSFPVIGYGAAAVHWHAGNEDHARRAAFDATYSTMIYGGAMVGTMIAGPLGGAVGAAMFTAIAIESGVMAGGNISDPGLKTELSNTSPGTFAKLMLVNFLAAGSGGYLTTYVGNRAAAVFATTTFSAQISEISTALLLRGISLGANTSVKFLGGEIIKELSSPEVKTL